MISKTLVAVACALLAFGGGVEAAAQQKSDNSSDSESARDSGAQTSRGPAAEAIASAEAVDAPSGPQPSDPPMLPQGKQPAVAHKLGPLDISINWRTRAEGWNWFEGKTGNSDYPFWHSLLRVGIGQNREYLDWFVEGEQIDPGVAERGGGCAPSGPTWPGRHLLRGQRKSDE